MRTWSMKLIFRTIKHSLISIYFILNRRQGTCLTWHSSKAMHEITFFRNIYSWLSQGLHVSQKVEVFGTTKTFICLHSLQKGQERKQREKVQVTLGLWMPDSPVLEVVWTWPNNVFLVGRECRVVCGIFPDQELNSCPLHWELRVLTTGLLGKSIIYFF